jgi:hypothetical protein
MILKPAYLGCVCLTCGIRNDADNPSSFCRNGHDDWLEYRDVMGEEDADPKWLKRALRLTRMGKAKFVELFLDPEIKQFPINGAKKTRKSDKARTVCCNCTIEGLREEMQNVKGVGHFCEDCYDMKFNSHSESDE